MNLIKKNLTHLHFSITEHCLIFIIAYFPQVFLECNDDDDGGGDIANDDLGDQDISEEERKKDWAKESPAGQPVGAQLRAQHEVDVPDQLPS